MGCLYVRLRKLLAQGVRTRMRGSLLMVMSRTVPVAGPRGSIGISAVIRDESKHLDGWMLAMISLCAAVLFQTTCV